MSEQGDAEDRTEEPTPRRLAKAREEGRSAVSREAVGLASAAGAVLALFAGTGAARDLIQTTVAIFAGAGPAQPFLALGLAALRLTGLAGGGALLGGLLAALAQGAPMPSWPALKPSGIDRIVSQGIKRTLGLQGLRTHLLHLMRLAAIVAVTWIHLSGLALPGVAEGLSPAELGWAVARLTGDLTLLLFGVMAVFAAIDLLLERRRFFRSLRMTRADLRDEYRETEGDPLIKLRIRRLQRRRAQDRTRLAVAGATVVVTNPTHVAVALSYDTDRGNAPRVVAKGMDAVAHRIRAHAIAAGVPIVSNPPLARALLPVRLGAEIPAEHYRAVAEVIAYVMAFRRRPEP